jgi:hypothetical protein
MQNTAYTIQLDNDDIQKVTSYKNYATVIEEKRYYKIQHD